MLQNNEPLIKPITLVEVKRNYIHVSLNSLLSTQSANHQVSKSNEILSRNLSNKIHSY